MNKNCYEEKIYSVKMVQRGMWAIGNKKELAEIKNIFKVIFLNNGEKNIRERLFVGIKGAILLSGDSKLGKIFCDKIIVETYGDYEMEVFKLSLKNILDLNTEEKLEAIKVFFDESIQKSKTSNTVAILEDIDIFLNEDYELTEINAMIRYYIASNYGKVIIMATTANIDEGIEELFDFTYKINKPKEEELKEFFTSQCNPFEYKFKANEEITKEICSFLANNNYELNKLKNVIKDTYIKNGGEIELSEIFEGLKREIHN